MHRTYKIWKSIVDLFCLISIVGYQVIRFPPEFHVQCDFSKFYFEIHHQIWFVVCFCCEHVTMSENIKLVPVSAVCLSACICDMHIEHTTHTHTCTRICVVCAFAFHFVSSFDRFLCRSCALHIGCCARACVCVLCQCRYFVPFAMLLILRYAWHKAKFLFCSCSRWFRLVRSSMLLVASSYGTSTALMR